MCIYPICFVFTLTINVYLPFLFCFNLTINVYLPCSFCFYFDYQCVFTLFVLFLL